MRCKHNIYIHVPYCAKKCNYCAFYSHACAAPDWDAYLAGILAEINYWGELAKNPPTIFFGGGTPSLAPPRVINKIIAALEPAADCEITIEANPGTMESPQDYDISRLSVGAQSLNDADLDFLGRIHTAADALTLLKKSRARTSADFIYALPNQSAADVATMCRRINDLPIEHASLYELTIEAGTPFANIKPNEAAADMYLAIQENLRFPRYEISNYGAPCQHNANIWDGQPYIGLGDGAHGRPLIDGIWHEDKTPMSNRDRAIEKVITGLRTMRGVLLTDDVREVINTTEIESAKLKIENNRLIATEKSLLLLDSVLLEIINY